MKKVLITGCNGFIGKKLALFLASKKITIIGCDISDSASNELKDIVIYKKISELSSFCDDFKDIDVLYHLAWCGVSTSDKNDFVKQFSNFDITYKILLFSKKANIKKIIIPGSASQYSNSTSEITGNERPTPADLYAATKCAIQIIARHFCDVNKISLNWLLITSVYGSTRNDNNLISYTIKSLKSNEKVITTKLEQEWDYLYIDDLIQALYLIGLKGKNNIVYPVGSGEHHPLRYYVELIANILHKENLLEIGKLPYKNDFVDSSVVCIDELNEIGFKTSNNFKNNIEKIIPLF